MLVMLTTVGFTQNIPAPEVAPTLRQPSGKTTPSPERLFVAATPPERWTTLWKDTPPPVTVDFATEEAIFCVMGQRDTEGFGITITGITETPQRITVSVEEMTPSSGIPPPRALYQRPYALAIIAKSDKPVYFKDEAAGGTIVPIITTITNTDSLHHAPTNLVIKDVAAWCAGHGGFHQRRSALRHAGRYGSSRRYH
jgi:hypothetical protein